MLRSEEAAHHGGDKSTALFEVDTRRHKRKHRHGIEHRNQDCARLLGIKTCVHVAACLAGHEGLSQQASDARSVLTQDPADALGAAGFRQEFKQDAAMVEVISAAHAPGVERSGEFALGTTLPPHHHT